MSKNDFFYIGRGFIQDHRGPHKTQKKLEKRAENGPKTGLGTGTGMNRPGYEPNRTEPNRRLPGYMDIRQQISDRQQLRK